MKDHERSWGDFFLGTAARFRKWGQQFEPIQIQSLPRSGLMKPLGCFTNIFVANECCLGWYPLTNQPRLMKSYECTHWMPDCKSHLAFGHRNFSMCISQRSLNHQLRWPEATSHIKCQCHIALLGTNIWKKWTNIKYQMFKYQISNIIH